ncbi:N-acetyltransferase [Mariprofundus sp. EBB-1]|uniref:GNAT family N-acetyltransferase n=1 Tax=Mariprofundus sp. EBB-1 TaxID=2650971 RepID=UPI00137AA89F|nr:GNAT family N-acetyltransferase [Mariprofundus sp. EBB-1]
MFTSIETKSDITHLVVMAREIWSEYFSSIFDSEILLKLIEGAQSRSVISSQIKDGYQYFFIIRDGEKIGYFAYKLDHTKDELFLSKIYIYSNHRGEGVGRKVLSHLERIGHNSGISKIVLTVYHGNKGSIRAYEHWGFSSLGLIKRDFGNGLEFEDIKMEKLI